MNTVSNGIFYDELLNYHIVRTHTREHIFGVLGYWDKSVGIKG